MKSITLIFIFSAWYITGWCQISVTPVTLSSTSYGSCYVNYTVGEMTSVNTVGSISGTHVTTGFEQPVTEAYEQLVSNLPGCITAITQVGAGAISFDLFPNPASQTCWLQFTAPEGGTAEFIVTDITGRQLIYSKNNCPAGNNSLQTNVSHLSSGPYLFALILTDHNGISYRTVKHFSIIN